MNHDHTDIAKCPYCITAKNQKGGDKAFGEKLRAFLGVCGCLSCYAAMFPAILLGIIGIFGLSNAKTLDVLNAYMGSVLFQPILIISILLLIVGLLRYGKTPLVLSFLAGIGIFVSMNFYMRSWLFTLSFALLALAYYLAFRKTKTPQLKIALIFLIAVVLLGVVDIGRSVLPAQSSTPNTTGTTQTAQISEITLRAGQSSFEPRFAQIPVGSRVKLIVVSEEVPHQIYIPDARIDEIVSPGDTKVFEFTLVRASTIGFLCFVDCSRHDSMIPFLGAGDSTHDVMQ